ncbi:hypothetical protein QYF61_027959 [Mycteria americana]|uniref:Alpha/beta hydrolase fold-3 domain-containing protein n=1 Tax=Mycteria americana TaxID=33587 RepID=A0AAN7N2I7_MYCAM|nr:hypothetical protein QYF61_027959 [Mycteria americana]
MRAAVADQLGLMHHTEVLTWIMAVKYITPMSDENVTVTDAEFSDVAVRLYLRDVYWVVKFFPQSSVLSQYGVDPDRVCVAGDGAGGNLAAAVAQQLLEDSEVKTKLKALLYPALQTLDLNLPSYQESESPFYPTMASNRRVPVESSHSFQFVNQSNLLPEELKNDHVYTSPTYGSSELAQKYPGFLDPRVAPLLASDAQPRGLPLAYVLTCERNVLRDDGAT